MFRIYTKIDGKLANWDTDANVGNYELARDAVREELGNSHKSPIFVLITNDDPANDTSKRA